ncbi:MAG: ParB/RepB/Spo0J family partition protein [Puniceicoccales bacterium]|jgi:ParB family chromosome partitioning protein|nr:ParB/RepB/Spo0J family partition protein [Puniceicoccales bacterium]
MAGDKKLRLGRGLDHLIAEGLSRREDIIAPEKKLRKVVGDEVQELPMKHLMPNGKQARRTFDEKAIRELADSIAAEGLLQPIIVHSVEGERYEIIAGERRFRAMQKLGKETITARIIDANEQDCAIISLVENLQRESLNPVEEAAGFSYLAEEFKLTQEQIAQKVGKARATIANSLRLLNLDEEALQYLESGKITVGHAKILLSIENPEMRLFLLTKIIDGDLNVRQTEYQAHILKAGKPIAMPSTPRELSESLIKIEKQISKQLAANVSLEYSAKRGKIIIEYHGEQELLRIVQSMGIE